MTMKIRINKRFEIVNLAIALMFIVLTWEGQRLDAQTSIRPLLDSLAATNHVSSQYTNVVAKFKHPDSNMLRLIEGEVQDIGRLEKQQRYSEASDRIYMLREALLIAGTNLVPLRPKLETSFLSGNSIGASGWALVAIGPYGYPTLLCGITNVNARVRAAAVEAMPYVKGTNALKALSLLETLSNEPPTLHIQVIDSISKLDVNNDLKRIKLLQFAESETNVTAKCIAIKCIGQLGIDDAGIIEFLKQASKDANESVRYSANVALQNLKLHKVNP
jgi:HEAT repeat protein